MMIKKFAGMNYYKEIKHTVGTVAFGSSLLTPAQL
jgi:hypothetical protein